MKQSPAPHIALKQLVTRRCLSELRPHGFCRLQVNLELGLPISSTSAHRTPNHSRLRLERISLKERLLISASVQRWNMINFKKARYI